MNRTQLIALLLTGALLSVAAPALGEVVPEEIYNQDGNDCTSDVFHMDCLVNPCYQGDSGDEPMLDPPPPDSVCSLIYDDII